MNRFVLVLAALSIATPALAGPSEKNTKQIGVDDIEFCTLVGGYTWDKRDLEKAITRYEAFSDEEDPPEIKESLVRVKAYLVAEQLKNKPGYDECVKDGVISDDDTEETVPTASNPPT